MRKKTLSAMNIGVRLRQIRNQKRMSQGDIEAATGLHRSYTSRVEHGNTVPSLETLERFANALGVPLYALIYDAEMLPPMSSLTDHPSLDQVAELDTQEGEDARLLLELKNLIRHIVKRDREVLLCLAKILARRQGACDPL
jgi:transcriptional regulator with XRE-family HTH domain